MAHHSAEYTRLGASVVAIVAQPSEKVKRYVEDTGLPFDILVDERREIIKSYGVWHSVGLDAWNISRPALFLIDRSGVIRYVFVANWQTEFPEHEDLVRELQQLGRVDGNPDWQDTSPGR